MTIKDFKGLCLKDSSKVIFGNNKKEYSVFCYMVLELMETNEFSENYYGALNIVVGMFDLQPNDIKSLETELNNFI